ncbi:Dockerin type I repeat protein [Planctomycetes bacterium CA13]|uniref:Dockerin type I repeat protein n=1 Tax=Novipirellula herctigrandis TaxID=2527986 RepID=A0A5C5Z9B4_9BACT|nr:Dockerin type I repeat protein [Planctomycetes bacterium CA13]
MTLRRIRSLFGSTSERRTGRKGFGRRSKAHRSKSRQMLAQALESRQLLAGPDLIAIRPDSGALLQGNDTLNIAPREFNLLFQGGANIDESTIGNSSIQLVRSGGDGAFFDPAITDPNDPRSLNNDIAVSLGYIGLGEPNSTDPDDLQRIVFRPSSSASFNATDPTSAFPDDTYQIQIVGAGGGALTNLSGEAFNDGVDFQTTFRLDRGAQVVSVVPQPVSRNTQQIMFASGVTGGSFTLSLNGETTDPLSVPTSNAAIKSALEALDGVQTGDVLVGGTREVTFQGQFAGEQVPLMVMDTSSLVGGTGNVVRSSSLSQASNQIVVYFDDQAIDGAEVVDPKYYRLINTSGTFSTNDDSTMLPESVSYDRAENSVVLTFAAAIPEGNYRLDIGDSGGDNSTLAGAVKVGRLSSDNAFSQNGFIGDVGGSSTDAADVDLYEVKIVASMATTALNVSVSPNAGLEGLVRILDAGGAELATQTAAAGVDIVVPAFAIAADGTFYIEVSSADGVSTGSYTVNASVTDSPIDNRDDNTTINDATDLGSLGAAGITIGGQISPQSIPLPPLVGSEDDLGHRQIQREAHIASTGTTPTVPSPTRVVRYYFPATLGADASGGDYTNLITATEKQIVRDIFEIYAQQSGYEFIESPGMAPGDGDLMIGKGDLRSLDPGVGPNSGVAGLGGGNLGFGAAVLNGAIYDGNNRFFGDGFTGVMFHEIGHTLGLGHAYDVPATMGGALPNNVSPGDNDIIHLQRIMPPNSTDIDMYQFTLDQPGRFTAETFAERLATPSLLNTALTLYREIAGGDIEVVSRNDQYVGADSLIDISLEPGTYFIGVSSTGNTNYDPRVKDSGFGGTTNGAYELKLAFDADRDGALRDASGTVIDGDNDGNPGGVYSFWFQSSDPSTTLYVDKIADTTANVPQGSGAINDPIDELDRALLFAGNRIVIPNDATEAILDGQSFKVDDGVNVATFTYGGAGLDHIVLDPADSVSDIATKTNAAILAAQSANRLNATVEVSVTGKVVQLGQIDNLDITESPTFLTTPNLVKVVGNGGADQNIDTLADNRPYLVGLDTGGNPLVDGGEFLVPQGVNVMIHAGALFKMRKANLDAGSSSANISRATSSMQVLGTPNNAVFLRSFHDDSVGGESDGVGPAPNSSDFGGIVLRDDSDLEENGIFLNYVNHVDIKHGGGKVFVDANESVFSPIHLVDSRPTISFNRITDSDDAAISASPDSFDDSLGRIGPTVVGNSLADNSINGLFIRVETPVGGSIDTLTVSGRFDDTDITHVLSENLIIAGASGGPTLTSTGTLVARAAGRLVVDPGIVMKMNRAVIQVQRGSGSLIAEGTVDRPIVFTSFKDDRYGGSGSFDADNTTDSPMAGDWSGLYFGQATSGSLDHAIITYAGGVSNTSGAAFNAVEVHQADFRITNSLLQDNASGAASGVRGGLGANASSVIYVRGAQPIIMNNEIVDNDGPAISINANALRYENMRDAGRSVGDVDLFSQFADNSGPLVRLNQLDNNSINGMVVRGEVLVAQSIWDDTDIVHVLQSEIIVDNLHHVGGLRLQSSNSESLVVKLSGGANVGFTATGTPVEIDDRVGGTIQVLGTVGHPVILTALADDLVGAGFTPTGEVMKNTNNSGSPSTGTPGAWRGFLFDEFSNDRNVAVVRELENAITNKLDVNANPTVSQLLGTLAKNEKSGDESSRLGFEVSGYISPNDANDVDVYSFVGTAGTEVWLDVDRTDTTLDAVIEVVNAAGTVLARSMRSGEVGAAGDLNTSTLTKNTLLGGDHYTQNFRDPGLRYTLPGTPGAKGTYFVRIRSNPASSTNKATIAGESRGNYTLQIRLNQTNEFPGSTVQYADIRFAQTGIDVQGLPAHSPLIGEGGELAGQGGSYDAAQSMINVLQSDIAALSISGELSDANDVDWYEFDVAQTGVQVIPGQNDDVGTVAVVFDLDYSDNAVRGDTTIAVYDSNQNLVYVGRESNIEDDQPSDPTDPNTAVSDLGRGSLGVKDAYIGPVHLPSGGTYYVAVMSDRQLPSAMTGSFVADLDNDANAFVRLEPVNSVTRVVEDHIGFSGYDSRGSLIAPETDQIFGIESVASLNTHIPQYRFEDVSLYLATDRATADADDRLYIVDPYNGGAYSNPVSPNSWSAGADDVQDIVVRSDGRMFGYQRVDGVADSVGRLVEIDPSDGSLTTVALDNIPGEGGVAAVGASARPNTRDIDRRLGSHLDRADQFTNSDDVDALTFERQGNLSAAPIYDVYYVVRESDDSSKLYRGNTIGDATPTPAVVGGPNATGNIEYGLMGNIQVNDNAQVDFVNGADTTGVLLTGINGTTFTVQVTRTTDPTGITAVNVAARTATINLDSDFNPSAQEFMDLINNDVDVSQFVEATLRFGDPLLQGTFGSPQPTDPATPFTDIDTYYRTITFDDGAGEISTVRVSSKLGTFTLSITRRDEADAVTAVNVANQTATVNLDGRETPTVSVLVNLINNHAEVSQFLRASVETGLGGSGSNTSPAATSITDRATSPTVRFNNGLGTTARVVLDSLDGTFTLTITRDADPAVPTGVTAFDPVLHTATINLTTDPLDQTTVGEFINLINTDPQLIPFVSARIGGGSVLSDVGTPTSPAAGDSIAIAATVYEEVDFFDGVTTSTARITSIGLDSIAPGILTDPPYQVTITRNFAPTSITTISEANREFLVNLDAGSAPSVQDFVDLINNDTIARRYMYASIAVGDDLSVGQATSPAVNTYVNQAATYANTVFSVIDDADPPNVTNIRVQSTLPTADGDFVLNITRPGNRGNAVVLGVDLANRVINLEIGAQNGGGPTAGEIIDALNQHVDARQLVTAVIVGGNATGFGDGNEGTDANVVGRQNYVAGTGERLRGRVTGISFDDPVTPSGTLYGVTAGGEFIRIEKNTGNASILFEDPAIEFAGLALGPQNVEGGLYADMFFAITSTRDLYAFDVDGNLQAIFAGGATSVSYTDPDNGGTTSDVPVGIAFSPIDVNLWHPTTRRATDAGHGINTVVDSTRAPGSANVNYVDNIGADRSFNQGQGGASFYFGLEQHIPSGSFNSNTQGYLTYEGVNAQWGFSENLQRDLTSNPNIANTYNLPGGAFGSLMSDEFSLAGSVAEDRPTLYLNYYLETENHAGETDANGQDPFRDSARVYASRDNGATWELLATNNSALSAPDPSDNPKGELPGFLSHLSDAGLNSDTPRAEGHQIVQELFDQTAGGAAPQTWRQLRVDLSTFADEANVQLRFDFATAGRVAGDPLDNSFGERASNLRSNASQNNQFEGFFIDDIIVGYAERGEMVSGTNSDTTITNLYAGGSRTQDRDPNARPDIVNGPYQIEIRRTGEYVLAASGGPQVAATFDTNDRHINSVLETGIVTLEGAPGTYPDTTPVVDTRILGVDVPAADIVEWEVSTDQPFTGDFSLKSGAVSATQQHSVYQFNRSDLVADDTAGVIEFSYSVSSAADAHGLRFLIDGVAQKLTPPDSDFPGRDTLLATGNLGYRTVQFSFSGGDHHFAWVYDFTDPAAAEGLNEAFIDDIRILQGGTGLVADRNRQRAQGVFIIDSNFISDSSVVGIHVQPGQAEAGGSVPHAGSTINFPQLNSGRLIPGVVIQNNLVAGSSGIIFAGETNPNPQRPVPYGKIINNTLVGDGQTGIGVDVVGLASPTVMNNLMTDLAVGLNGGSGSVIRSNFFQGNAANGTTGAAAILAGGSEPLFVDKANRNYYLLPGSKALDSSQDVEQDRAQFVTFKNSFDIPESPTSAPSRDVYGQLRIDSGGTGGGTGANVFIDRGAVDRSDKDQPYAVLLNPVDNDVDNEDRDPNETVVHMTNPLLENFKILLGDGRGPNSPFEGTGVNGLTVDDPNDLNISTDGVQIVHNGRLLVENTDYSLGYNPQTGVLLLTPLSTLWEPTGVYTITLDNTQIADLAGNPLRSNQTDGSTKFFILMPDVELDFGDAPSSFDTLLAENPARHTIQPGATPRLGARVDGEPDSPVPAGSDDTAQTVWASSPDGLFLIAASVDPAQNGYMIDVDPTATAVGGEELTVQIGLRSETFELVLPGFAAKRGNIAVALTASDSASDIATNLADAIREQLVAEGDASSVTIDATLPEQIAVLSFDDEDGVAVGTYRVIPDPADPAVFTDYTVFLNPGAPALTTDSADVLGFLNPLDKLGTTISVNASSAGKLDAWIDFNYNGTFDVTEQIFKNVDLVAGDNTLTIQTPIDTAAGSPWARFRISEEGNLGPDELAIGGEVEDYQFQVFRISPTIPEDDSFSVDEDVTLDTAAMDMSVPPAFTEASLFDNEVISGFLPPRFLVYDQPTKGTLTVTDDASGRFVYTPADDYYGEDTFTYWVTTQPVQGAVASPAALPDNVTLATVTITVKPVNDVPLAVAGSFVTLEDTAITIDADELLSGAVADELAQYPAATPPAVSPSGSANPWNEDNQTLTVVALTIPVLVGDTNVTTSGSYETARGTFDVTFAGGILDQLVYTPKQDLNRDNRRAVADPPIFEEFSFTIQDDGLSIDPVDSTIVTMGAIQTSTKMVSIDVKPENDDPVANDDVISENNVRWATYNAGLATPVTPAPIPTEDTDFVIPHAYLISNDFNARDTAFDELDLINDGVLTVTGVDAASALGGTVSIVGGNLVYRAPEHAYGLDTFSYTITDAGVNIDVAGVSTDAPLMHTATVTVLVKPINDKPLANDLDVTLSEAVELIDGTNDVDPNAMSEGVGFKTITAAELLRLGAVGGALETTFSTGSNDTYDEHEQDLRVVGFGLPGATTPSVDAVSLTYDVNGEATEVLQTASGQLELSFEIDATTGVGTFVSLVYTPDTDYNNRSEFPATDPFVYFVEDFGELTVYGADQVGESTTSVDHGSLRSDPATVVMTVTPVNDVPIFPEFSTVELVEDEAADFAVVVRDIYIDPLVMITPGAESTALDEIARQGVTIEIAELNVPTGMFASLPVLDESGVLTLTPNPDVYGWAVFEVTVTDDGQSYDSTTGTFVDDPLTAVRSLTVHISPVNDAPVSVDRNLEVTEAEEFAVGDGSATNLIARLPLTPADFLGGTTANSVLAEQSDFADNVLPNPALGEVEYDEDEQSLRVVQFTVTDVDGNLIVVDRDNQNGVELTLATGKITFNFDPTTGEFTDGEYYPDTDYNERPEFVPTEAFTYIVEDFGPTTIPGADVIIPAVSTSIDYTLELDSADNLNNRSEPKLMTIRTRSMNDVPEFDPITNVVKFAEDVQADNSIVYYDVYGGTVLMGYDPAAPSLAEAIFVSRDTALDERANETLTFTTTMVAPTGMFASTPTLDQYGVLALTPNPDVFGYAVLEITATDDGQSYDPASGLSADTRSITRTITVNITPVNDAPISFDRELEFTERHEPDAIVDGFGQLPITVEDLLRENTGVVSDPADANNPAKEGDFAATLESRFDEHEQQLRVVEFTVTDDTGADVIVDKDNFNGIPLKLATGTIAFNFEMASGAFTGGVFVPDVDYNRLPHFDPLLTVEQFTYIVEDFGATTIPGADQVSPVGDSPVDYTTDGGTPPVGLNHRSEPKMVTITVKEANDLPVLPSYGIVQLVEDLKDNTVDASGNAIAAGTVNPDNEMLFYDIYSDPTVMVLPGPLTAKDELALQNVVITVTPENVPLDMFATLPSGAYAELSTDGILTVQPNPDVFGVAVFKINVTDTGLDSDGNSDPQSVERLITINIAPVNDAPVAYPRALSASESVEFDEFGQPLDVPVEITFNALSLINGDASLGETPDAEGLFDGGLSSLYNEDEQELHVIEFLVLGPDSDTFEIKGSDFVGQTATQETRGGGVLEFTFDADGFFTEGVYRPATDFNREAPYLSPEFFAYTIQDDGATEIPPSGSLLDPALPVERSELSVVTIEVIAVNDSPIFVLPSTEIEVLEDNSVETITSVATGISPGGGLDEVNQELEFTLTADGFVATDFFAVVPTMNVEGDLTFQPGADVFGDFVFDVTLADNPGTTDSAVSTQKLTIHVRPQNDAPLHTRVGSSISYAPSVEDTEMVIPLVGSATETGLLDVFVVGPTNETSTLVGGGQSISMQTPLTNRTAKGGTLTPVVENGVVTGLTYLPRLDFVGIDTFVYTITDGGISIDLNTDGEEKADALTATGTVTLTVTGVNDPPQFSGAADHTSAEDQGTVTVKNWATGIRPGPIGAADEVGQAMNFIVTQDSGQTDLLVGLPEVVISGGTASLVYTAAQDQFGVAVFTAILQDDGVPVADSTPAQFTITITPVNDPPTFTAGSPVSVNEDSGEYEEVDWATMISPGPANESDQTVVFNVVTPVESQSLFAPGGLPQVSDDGTLTFEVAENASGVANVEITANDSEGFDSETVTLTISIVEQEDAVVAVDDTLDTDEDAVLELDSIDLTGNDIDPDLATNPEEVLTIVMPPSQLTSKGAVLTYDSATGRVVYNPATAEEIQAMKPSDSTVDSFTYEVRDHTGNTSTATVTLNISGLNDAPILANDGILLNESGPTVVTPLVNDIDVDGTIVPSSIIITAQPQFGALTVENDGTVIYTPNESFSRVDTFDYTVGDNLGQQSEPASVTISLSLLPNVPDFNGVVATSKDTTTLDVGAASTAIEGTLDLTSIQIVDGPSHGTATVNDDGTIGYIADAGYLGPDSFQFTIADSEGRVSDPATVNISVVEYRLQNPDPTKYNDVNANGDVTAFDALLIINRLTETPQNVASIPVTSMDQGPNYYDVNGDDTITALDALLVINQLSQQDDNSVSGEQVVTSDLITATQSASGVVDTYASAVDLQSTPENLESASPKKMSASTSPSQPLDVVDLIAESREGSQEQNDEKLEALDEAFANLL